MSREMEETLSRPLDEQFAYLRQELAGIRDDLELIREGLRRAIHEMMMEGAEPRQPAPD